MRRKVWAVKHWRARHEPDDHLRRGSRTPLQYYKRPIRGDNKAIDRQTIDAEDAAIVKRGGWELLAVRDLLLKHAGDHAHWRGYFLDRIAMRAATVRQIAEAIAPKGCPIDPKRLGKHLADLTRPEIDFLHRVEIDEVVEYVRPEGDDKGDLGRVRLVDVVQQRRQRQKGRQGRQDGPGADTAGEAAAERDGRGNAGRDPQQPTVTADAEIGGLNPQESAPVRGNTDANADPPSAAADGGSNANANTNADANGGGQPPGGRPPPTAPGGTAAGSSSDPDSDTHGGGGPGPSAPTPAACDPATTPGSPEGEGGSGPPPPAVGAAKGSGRGPPAAGGEDGEPGDDQRTDGERLGAMLDEPEKLAKLVTEGLGIDKGPMTVRERRSQEAAIKNRWSEAVELLRRAGGSDEAIGEWAAKRIAKARHLGRADGLLSQDEGEAIVAKLPAGTAAAMEAAACAALRRATLQKRARIWMADTAKQASKAADAICPASEVSA